MIATAKTRKKERKTDIMNTDLTTAGIRFISGGKFTSQDTWIHPVGTYETWEIIYMISGTAHLYEGDRTFSISAGDGLLLAPGTEHGGTEPSVETVSFFWMHFCADRKTHQVLTELPKSVPYLDNTQIPLFCRQILLFSQMDSYPKEMNALLLRLLLTEYAVHAEKEDVSPEYRVINDIREWIRINTKKRALTAAEVAVQFGYNEDYLNRLFRQKTGIGLKSWINKIRMDHIRTALLTTDESLKTIAYNAGFPDYKTFLKYFTYHESVTPTALREHFFHTHTNNH